MGEQKHVVCYPTSRSESCSKGKKSKAKMKVWIISHLITSTIFLTILTFPSVDPFSTLLLWFVLLRFSNSSTHQLSCLPPLSSAYSDTCLLKSLTEETVCARLSLLMWRSHQQCEDIWPVNHSSFGKRL